MFIKSKVHTSWLKGLLVILALVLLIGGIVSTTQAAPLEQAETQTVHLSHSHTSIQNIEMSQKVSILHFENGHPTGGLHWIDIGLYYEIIDILLASGHEPSPRNIDHVYHLITD